TMCLDVAPEAKPSRHLDVARRVATRRGLMRTRLMRLLAIIGLVAAAWPASAGAHPPAAHGGGSHAAIVVLRGDQDAAAVAVAHGRRFGANVTDVYRHALHGYAA